MCVEGEALLLLLLLEVGDAVAPQCACVEGQPCAERNIDSTRLDLVLVFHLCSTAIAIAGL